MSTQKSETSQVKDSGKIHIGGGATKIIKPPVKDKGKIKVGGASLSLVKDKGRIKIGGASLSLVK
jgi:hypothetical protein